MTAPIRILIISLILLAFVITALLALIGKLDRWYHWAQADNDKPSEQRIARWRRAFAIEILIATAVIVVLNATDIFDEYASYLFIALGAAGAMIERGWIRKV